MVQKLQEQMTEQEELILAAQRDRDQAQAESQHLSILEMRPEALRFWVLSSVHARHACM